MSNKADPSTRAADRLDDPGGAGFGSRYRVAKLYRHRSIRNWAPPLWGGGFTLLACASVGAPRGLAQERSDSGSAPPSALVLQGTTLVDVKTGRLHADQTVVVVGTRVQAVGPTKKVRVPAGALVVKATGTYLIPGLWDMHVHPQGNESNVYPLFIANGVTGVRDMSTSSVESVLEWRRAIMAGTRVGPRALISGPALASHVAANHPGFRGRRPWHMAVSTPAEARRVVDSLKMAGADFIKMYEGSREVYFAIAAEARRVGLPLAGHVPGAVTAVEASDSGHRSIEHRFDCDMDAPPRGVGMQMQTPSLRRCRAMAHRLRKNNTWFSVASVLVGTTQLHTSWSHLMRYWPDSVLFWPLPTSQRNFDSASMAMAVAAQAADREDPGIWSARGTEKWASAHEKGEGTLSKLHRAGVRLLAGTDTGPLLIALAAVPGFSLHNVLSGLVLEGLTPLEALQTATLNPAEYLDATDSLGTIASGKVADLVLLDANPLADIYNTRRIRAVVANGRMFDRGDLDLLLLEAEQRARGVK